MEKLHYFKCIDCLTPVSVRSRRPEMTCDCGGTSFEWMGEVSGDSAVKEEERCKCNSLCTFAAGPRCDCVCAGRNHGLGMLAIETVDVVTGKVKFAAKVKEKNKIHGEWYRVQKARQLDGSLYGKYAEAKAFAKKGGRINYDDYRVIMRVDNLMLKFNKARTVKSREKIAADIQRVVADPTQLP